jgi:hypothetical protein
MLLCLPPCLKNEVARTPVGVAMGMAITPVGVAMNGEGDHDSCRGDHCSRGLTPAGVACNDMRE